MTSVPCALLLATKSIAKFQLSPLSSVTLFFSTFSHYSAPATSVFLLFILPSSIVRCFSSSFWRFIGTCCPIYIGSLSSFIHSKTIDRYLLHLNQKAADTFFKDYFSSSFLFIKPLRASFFCVNRFWACGLHQPLCYTLTFFIFFAFPADREQYFFLFFLCLVLQRRNGLNLDNITFCSFLLLFLSAE